MKDPLTDLNPEYWDGKRWRNLVEANEQAARLMSAGWFCAGLAAGIVVGALIVVAAS